MGRRESEPEPLDARVQSLDDLRREPGISKDALEVAHLIEQHDFAAALLRIAQLQDQEMGALLKGLLVIEKVKKQTKKRLERNSFKEE